MGISVPGLLNFRGDRWQVAADLLRSSARGSTAQADSLRAAADAMSKAWSDEIGAMIAERCRQQAHRRTAQSRRGFRQRGQTTPRRAIRSASMVTDPM